MKPYRINQFSQRCGVSQDTLRYYEKMDLLHPEHDPENDYRYYSDEDMLSLMQVRSLRGMEIPIQALQAANLTDELVHFSAVVREQAEQISDEIEQLLLKKRRLDRLNDELIEMERYLNVCREISVPQMYVIYYDGAEETAAGKRLIQSWSQRTPYVHTSVRIPAEELQKPEDAPMRAVVGLGLLKGYVDRMGLSHDSPAQLTEGGRSVRCILKIKDPLHPTRRDFAPVFDYLAQTGQQTRGDWYYRIRFIEQHSDGGASYYIGTRIYLA